MRRGIRSGLTYVFALAGIATVGLLDGPAAAEAPRASAAQAEDDTQLMAGVKVEIRQESGDIVKGATTVAWNEDGSLTIDADGTTHELGLRIGREGTSKKLSITLAYSRAGEDIVAPYTFGAKIKKREVIRIEGNLAIAVTVTPRKVKTKSDEPKEKKPRVDLGGDPDDPLAGLD